MDAAAALRHESIMKNKRRKLVKPIRGGLRLFAAFAIGVQFLVPTGYMPGSVADGTPFVLCKMFSAAPTYDAVAQDHSAHHMDAMSAEMADMAPNASAHTQHSDHIGAEAWEHCPLGALSFGAALAFAIDSSVTPVEASQISTLAALPQRGISIFTQRARAPPLHALNQFA